MRSLPLRASSLVVASLLLSSGALAFQGPSRSLRDPLLYSRDYTPSGQASHARLAAWKEFQRRNEGTWWARFDERSHTPLRFWGSGIEVGTVADGGTALDTALQFFYENEEMLGDDVLVEDLVPAANVMVGETRYVSFHRTYRGIPVEGAVAHVRIRDGRLFMGGVDTHPGIDVPTSPSITAAAALDTVWSHLDPMVPKEGRSVRENPSLTIYPLPESRSYSYHLAWKTRVATQEGLWDVYVDALTGEVVDRLDRVMRVTGTLEVVHDYRTVEDPPVLANYPMGDNRIEVDGEDVTTAMDGSFTVDGNSPLEVTASVVGNNIKVQNQGSGGAEVTDSWDMYHGDTMEFAVGDPDDDEEKQSQLDVYAFLLQVRERAQSMDEDNDYAYGRVNAKVNQDSTCNAYFDGDLNFFQQGGGCNNTGRISDVVYHEFGHGFHYYQIVDGAGYFDSALSEGASDFMSGTIWNDPYLAPGFFTSGGDTWLREFDSNLVWPDDENYDPHVTGLIFAGAMWDLRTALIDTLGEEAGIAQVEHLYSVALAGAVDIPSTYEEVVAADDNNGNLGDGTPNICEINDAFSQHGMGPSGGAAGITSSHSPLPNQPPDEPIPVVADIGVSFPECVPYGIESTVIHYSTNGGSGWTDIAMTNTTGDTWEAQIPGQPGGTQVLYSIQVQDGGGGAAYNLPENPAAPFYMFYVGGLEEVFCDDFEESDNGWTHALLEGEDAEGADDWQRDRPRAEGGDPSEAVSGTRVWGNDLGANQYNGQYQPDKVNQLLSPTINLTGVEHPRLQFWRWLQVEDGAYDQAQVLVNEEVVWTNYKSPNSVPEDERNVHHQDQEWVMHDLDLAGWANQAEIRVAFRITSDPGLEFGGWTVDDVCVYSASEAGTLPGDDDDTPGDDDDSSPSDDDDDDATADDDDATSGDDDDASANDDGPGANEEDLFGDPDGCACDSGSRNPSPALSALGLLLALSASRRRRLA